MKIVGLFNVSLHFHLPIGVTKYNYFSYLKLKLQVRIECTYNLIMECDENTEHQVRSRIIFYNKLTPTSRQKSSEQFNKHNRDESITNVYREACFYYYPPWKVLGNQTGKSKFPSEKCVGDKYHLGVTNVVMSNPKYWLLITLARSFTLQGMLEGTIFNIHNHNTQPNNATMSFVRRPQGPIDTDGSHFASKMIVVIEWLIIASYLISM